MLREIKSCDFNLQVTQYSTAQQTCLLNIYAKDDIDKGKSLNFVINNKLFVYTLCIFPIFFMAGDPDPGKDAYGAEEGHSAPQKQDTEGGHHQQGCSQV